MKTAVDLFPQKRLSPGAAPVPAKVLTARPHVHHFRTIDLREGKTLVENGPVYLLRCDWCLEEGRIPVRVWRKERATFWTS